jgi:hypothetical protein
VPLGNHLLVIGNTAAGAALAVVASSRHPGVFIPPIITWSICVVVMGAISLLIPLAIRQVSRKLQWGPDGAGWHWSDAVYAAVPLYGLADACAWWWA